MILAQFWSSARWLGDKVEEETESLRGAVEGSREGLGRCLEELLADGRTHVERLIVRLRWRGGEGECWGSWLVRPPQRLPLVRLVVGPWLMGR